MPTILIISSHVAASRVGGAAQAAWLERAGVDTILVPTVAYGRHPGLGPPGGGPLSQEMFEGLLAGVEASGALASLDAVIAGYFATPEQVLAAAAVIYSARAEAPGVGIVVDPIMGDEERQLYVRPDVADAIGRELVPRADLITPNTWELARLSGLPVKGAAAAAVAARSVGRPALISSIPLGEDIGVLLVSPEGDWLARHRRQASAPKGTGDLLTASFVGHLVRGRSPVEALEASVSDTAAAVAGTPVEVRLESLAR